MIHNFEKTLCLILMVTLITCDEYERQIWKQTTTPLTTAFVKKESTMSTYSKEANMRNEEKLSLINNQIIDDQLKDQLDTRRDWRIPGLFATGGGFFGYRRYRPYYQPIHPAIMDVYHGAYW